MPGLCCQAFSELSGVDTESVFSIDSASIVFGRGSFGEVGAHLAGFSCKRVALFTDKHISTLPFFDQVVASIRSSNVNVTVYDCVQIEPTDQSFADAARFAKGGKFDGFVSLGGGSVIDTCKAASLYSTYPAELLTYVNAPIGEGKPVPGPLPVHIACPTTCGTGAECTGIAVFDFLSNHVKTGIVSRRLRPTMAIIDPVATEFLPTMVVAASGFDVLCHALESYTARPYQSRTKVNNPLSRPMSQGRNPWSDVGSLEAMKLAGKYFERAVIDANDTEAREKLAWAATLAGVAFGNAGVHLPHAMSYSVSGLVRDFRCPDYPQQSPLVPHGISVIVNAPSVFRYLSRVCPQRLRQAAMALGIEANNAIDSDLGELVAQKILRWMKLARVPMGLYQIGYHHGDLGALTEGAFAQQRLVNNAPCTITKENILELFEGAMSYG